jgi:hypothetical protein
MTDIKSIRQVIADRIHARAVETCNGNEPLLLPEVRAMVDELARQELRMQALARAINRLGDHETLPDITYSVARATLRAIADGSELP